MPSSPPPFTPIVVFVIDNSASMNQQCYLGRSLLDMAKGAAKNITTQRGPPGPNKDRYMIVTLSDKKNGGVVSGWKDSLNHELVRSRLRSIQADGLTTFGNGLKVAFDLLKKHRAQQNIDYYGVGRLPFYLEPAMIICITDGCKFSSLSQVHEDLSLPLNDQLPGSELTVEPFCWDYRLFSLVLRIPGNQPQADQVRSSVVPNYEARINLMCEITGGRSYHIQTEKTLNQCVESLMGKLQRGVVIHFERAMQYRRVMSGPFSTVIYDPSKNPDMIDRGYTWGPTLHKMIIVKQHSAGQQLGHWPIPESFWPDPSAATLPPRTAQPVLKVITVDVPDVIPNSLPYDKYDLEPSPLTQAMLERKTPSMHKWCWQVYVPGSGKQAGVHHVCGYLKATGGQRPQVFLYVLPYNYPALIPIVDKMHKQKPEWRREMEDYLRTVPFYYLNPMKRAFALIKSFNVVPDHFECSYGSQIDEILKKMRRNTLQLSDEPIFNEKQHQPSNGVAVASRVSDIGKYCLTNDPSFKNDSFDGFRLGEPDRMKRMVVNSFHNSFDIPRSKLHAQLRSMSLNLRQVLNSSFMHGSEMMGHLGLSSLRIRLQEKRELHNQPIADMGNYNDYMRNITKPLRDALEYNIPATTTTTSSSSTSSSSSKLAPNRVNYFGNPYSRAKDGDKVKAGMIIDETENYEDKDTARTTDLSRAPAGRQRPFSSATNSSTPKRKRTNSMSTPYEGPLHRHHHHHHHNKNRSKDTGTMSDSEFKPEFTSILTDAQTPPPLPPKRNKMEAIVKTEVSSIQQQVAVKKEPLAMRRVDDDVRTVVIKDEHASTTACKKSPLDDDDEKSFLSEKQFGEMVVQVCKLIRKPGIHDKQVADWLAKALLRPPTPTELMKVEAMHDLAARFKRHKISTIIQKYKDALSATANS